MVLLALLLTSAGLSGCDRSDDGGETSTSGQSRPAAPSLDLRTGVTRVAGELAPRTRQHLAERLDVLVGRYLRAAFLQEGGRAGEDRFPGFTSGARRRALEDRRFLTGSSFRDADRIRPVRAAAYVAVVSPEGRPAGATARVQLDLRVTVGDTSRPVHVRGRLLLTPTAKGWRIFGYDLAQSGAATRRGSR